MLNSVINPMLQDVCNALKGTGKYSTSKIGSAYNATMNYYQSLFKHIKVDTNRPVSQTYGSCHYINEESGVSYGDRIYIVGEGQDTYYVVANCDQRYNRQLVHTYVDQQQGSFGGSGLCLLIDSSITSGLPENNYEFTIDSSALLLKFESFLFG